MLVDRRPAGKPDPAAPGTASARAAYGAGGGTQTFPRKRFVKNFTSFQDLSAPGGDLPVARQADQVAVMRAMRGPARRT
jgi:hypothetical protein